MKNNKSFFEDGEANEWFRRNIEGIAKEPHNPRLDVLVNWLKPFSNEISNVLEIGCGSGHRLNQIVDSLSAKGFGVEPSSEAVEYIKSNFPQIVVKLGFGDDVPFSEKFDLVHLGFFLSWVDREFYLRCISEADRLVKFGGFLSIVDFETPFPYSNAYSHQNGMFTHKQNNSDVFVASGLYSVVNKFQYSPGKSYFDKDINERRSLTLLYKETQIFGKK
ncbi:class I SAM-dependent methyltransferase [bacterium]|nr:class I SAM-dependent methyltransferase [bacterium]